ncbi:pyrimidine operon attenuation protein / uracil phosphoribosyltransferase [Ekhidna lutea]|uniref:Pyrimidine operon attenuation protein / uracil phosphoribosyltransferase n=1 Tax=Ekhidna lutea TaxID=447679 RepID=A0A239J8Q6_EKHLU|nr:phosphoribosyltransferase domain-containing protein [Ekhidna lutea]SNT02175.1 pyrimidine operon attenuation protein / uracil phosphoribosyltransferase [Ekhidna lutea]
MSDNQILTQPKVDQIIRRIAYQIYENNMNDEVVLVGVDSGGRKLADQINITLAEIAGEKAVVHTISLDKENPLNKDILLDGDVSDLKNKTVILCDDVLNSGRTLAYSLTKLLTLRVKKVETAVLVLRTHGRFPIYANYKGYELSTTIKEHVEVRPGDGVFLN